MSYYVQPPGAVLSAGEYSWEVNGCIGGKHLHSSHQHFVNSAANYLTLLTRPCSLVYRSVGKLWSLGAAVGN